MLKIDKDIEEKIFNEMTFNDEQKLAIRAIQKGEPVQIIASAGTGKTRTLVGAVKWLIHAGGVDPSEILCLSYSNASAKDLRRKLSEINIPNNKKLHSTGEVAATTFHSLGYSFLPKSDIVMLEDLIFDYLIRKIDEKDPCVEAYMGFEKIVDIMEGHYVQNGKRQKRVKGVRDYFKIDKYLNNEERFMYDTEYNEFTGFDESVPRLRYYAMKPRNARFDYEHARNLFEDQIDEISSWISMFKEHEYTSDRMDAIYEIEKNGEHRALMQIIYEIYYQYIEYQQASSRIDFQDMIIRGYESVKNVENIKYIFVDEYQDISYTRDRLLKEVLKQSGAQLIVAGDDWQAIYGFNGSKSGYFSDFKTYYPSAQQIILNQTYRLSDDLAKASGDFIDDNIMISKQLRSSRKLYRPILIQEYTGEKSNEAQVAFNLLRAIMEEAETLEDKELYVLYRCRGDKSELDLLLNLKRDYFGNKNFYDYYGCTHWVKDENTGKRRKEKTIKFMTLHKAKGLEAKNVLLLGVKKDNLPIKDRDEELFKYVSFSDEYNVYDEERRLFYVGISRPTHHVYIMSPKRCEDQSPFLKELNESYIDKI